MLITTDAKDRKHLLRYTLLVECKNRNEHFDSICFPVQCYNNYLCTSARAVAYRDRSRPDLDHPQTTAADRHGLEKESGASGK